MLNYITLKKDQRFELRYYPEISDNIEGKIIYKGHKLGLNEKLLTYILDYKLERFSNKIYLRNYLTDDKWFSGTTNDTLKIIDKSYESLQDLTEQTFGKFRKVTITIV